MVTLSVGFEFTRKRSEAKGIKEDDFILFCNRSIFKDLPGSPKSIFTPSFS
jgi:hypothetical protein